MRRILAAALLMAAVLGAQKKSRKQEESEAHGPRLVKLNVSAIEGNGSRPGDLTQDDFQVFDNGKPQKIVMFRKADSRGEPVKALGPHEFSNRNGGAIPHATLILFDLLNDRMASKGYAWNEIIRTLQTLETNDYLYLYILSVDGKFYPVHGLPDEEGAPAGGDDGSWTKDVKAKLDAAMNKATRVRPIEMTDVNMRVMATFGFLETISARLAAIPGRKNLVWITRGIPIDISAQRSYTGDIVDLSGPVQQFATSMERSEIAVYPVDIAPPGMDAGADASNSTAQTASGAGMGRSDTLQQFADLTGGRSFLNQDVHGAIIQATGDARMSYQLAYYPAAGAYDGKFHKIKVTSSRKGLKVYSKNGYYAYKDEALTRNQQEATLDSAIGSQFDASQIAIRAVMSPSKKFFNSVHLEIGIEPGSQEAGKFLLTLADLHSDGRNGVSPTEAVDYPAGGGTVKLERERTVDGTVNRIRVIVMDEKSNAVGSLTVPVTAGDLSPAK